MIHLNNESILLKNEMSGYTLITLSFSHTHNESAGFCWKEFAGEEEYLS
jgi:hypothetical protein